MNRHRPNIRQRRPIFVGCEGESERGYVTFLGRLAQQEGLSIQLDPVLLRPGGGDPCDLIELAARKLSEKVRTRGIRYAAKMVLLDNDLIGQAPARDARGMQSAIQSGLELIWQSPCHEALLLRHLENCNTLRPPTTAIAQDQLRQRWPTYEKGMAASQLIRKLDLAAVRRAALVEPSLAALLQIIGLVT